MTPEDACAELERCAGTQFDPEVVRLFVDEVRADDADFEPLHLVRGDPELETRRDGEASSPIGVFGVVDGTTLLYSRRHLHDVARAEAQRAELQDRPFAVVLLELAALDRVNAERGWAAGDEELRAAARAVQLVAGRLGGTACRFGGATLALLVPGADARSIEHVEEAVGAALTEGPEVRLTHAAWKPGDCGDDVVERARRQLAARRARIA